MKTSPHRAIADHRTRLSFCYAIGLAGSLLATASHAAAIRYVGADLATSGAWRTPDVAKSMDGDGDNIYGTDGYVLATSPGGDVSKPPAYAGVTRLTSDTFYHGDITATHYQAVDSPTGLDRVTTGLWYSSGSENLQEQELAEIAVTTVSSFRIGVLVDQTDRADISPRDLRLRQVAGGNADSGLIFAYAKPDLGCDWYFFDVVGAQPGDTFRLSGTNQRLGSGAQDSNGIGAITFDRTTAASLDLGLFAGLTILGTVGTTYSVEYVAELTQANNSTAWHCLEFLRLPASPYLWVDKAAPATGRRFYRASVFPGPTNMVFIPPGTFRMGAPASEEPSIFDERPQTEVIMTRGFWMGKYEVTQREYQAVIGSNPSQFTDDPNLPVERVTWDNAVAYCQQLSERERAAGRIPTNCVYRLPTEAEWEYACRAGTSDRRMSCGDDEASLGDYAWWDPNSGGRTHPVGQKRPNAWGLYDMYGNVKEWCQELWQFYPGGYVIDPHPTGGIGHHPARGASYRGVLPRSALRNHQPDFYPPDTGFRVVLAPGQP